MHITIPGMLHSSGSYGSSKWHVACCRQGSTRDHMPLATAIAATAMKHARYGNVHPHTVLPFVVEHAGGINNEGMQFFRMCRDAADNKLNTRASDMSSWSSKGFSNCFLQSLSLANLKGLGHLFVVTAAAAGTGVRAA